MTKEQSKAHWWIVENHPDFRIAPPKKYFEICDIVFNALNQGQSLPIDSVVDEFCPKCKSKDVSEISDHYTKCGKCKFEYVG